MARKSNKNNLPFVKISKEEIRLCLENYILDQRRAYRADVPSGSDISDEIVQPEQILTDSELVAEHVDGALRAIVARSPHLQESVGVLPVFSPDAFVQVMETVAYNKIVVDPSFQQLLPSNIPLEMRSELEGAALAARDKEERKRNRQEAGLRKTASAVLKANKISKNDLLTLFLEKMLQSHHPILGNPFRNDLATGDCDQFIIPFRMHNHYTVAVVHCYQNKENKDFADIKYYDSLGSKLNEEMAKSLRSFWRDRGYKVNYQCVSETEQEDGYNCGIFASFKGIDIANKNIDHDERLLKGLTRKNYHDRFHYARYAISQLLEEDGYNCPVSKKLLKSIRKKKLVYKKEDRDDEETREIKSFKQVLGRKGKKQLFYCAKDTKNSTVYRAKDTKNGTVYRAKDTKNSTVRSSLAKRQSLGRKLLSWFPANPIKSVALLLASSLIFLIVPLQPLPILFVMLGWSTVLGSILGSFLAQKSDPKLYIDAQSMHPSQDAGEKLNLGDNRKAITSYFDMRKPDVTTSCVNGWDLPSAESRGTTYRSKIAP